jgi:phosphatidylethanolamine/phosphatidyl-N-methylethanolamine N-methyltransferase
LDGAHIVAAYARWAPVYDPIFGVITNSAIRTTVGVVNALPPSHILEVGVGTGIALPRYKPEHRITGIDLSPDMLERARKRIAARGMTNVDGLHGMDASKLDFPDRSFDAAVAMFLITVVPDPDKVLAEVVRVVKPGGRIVLANHFSAKSGPRAAIERWLSRFSASLGWHPEFAIETVLDRPGMNLLDRRGLAPLGLYTLLVFERI